MRMLSESEIMGAKKKACSTTVDDVDVALQNEAGPAALQETPKQHRFILQFEVCVTEFESATGGTVGRRNRVQELLALGAIRQLYWNLVADGVAAEAATVANWWKENHPKHQLGELIL